MSELKYPCTIFKTRRQMDDYSASDMRYGDLTEAQLKSHYSLDYISDQVDPWTLHRRSSMDRPQSMFCCNLRQSKEKVTRQQCLSILFDEFRALSRQFSLYGPYRYLIQKMITHMQNNTGSIFRDSLLDRALQEKIDGESSDENSTRFLLKKIFDLNIDWDNKYYPVSKKGKFYETISGGRLPKFNSLKDNFNGMGITVHDTWSTHIIIKSLQIKKNDYCAIVQYTVQDHFGLDSQDIMNKKFNQFLIFRIWFVLQRYKEFGFKPFITQMNSVIEISGSRDDI